MPAGIVRNAHDAAGHDAAPDGDFPAINMPHGAAQGSFAPMRPTPSGYVPGAPIISSPDLHEGLTRLQAGQTDFDVGGAAVAFSGIPHGLHNVLRDLQESPLGAKANQIESMTIEMVAMLFDFIFETKDLPDGIKALLARLQIPVLKAAMLDGAFFAKKSHPSRLLVNELAHAGLGWSTDMGPEDPLYRKLDEIVHQILDNFRTTSRSSTSSARCWRRSLSPRKRQPRRTSCRPPRRSTRTIASRSRRWSPRPRSSGGSKARRCRISSRRSCASNGRARSSPCISTTARKARSWGSGVTTLEDLVWSVQPKRSPEDRRHLVALLPSLLKRLSAGMQNRGWLNEDRESFMANLVEAHAAAVKPSLAQAGSPTAAVAEAAKVQAEIAKAAGDQVLAAKAEALAEAMTQAEPEPVEPEREVVDDDYLEIARSLERGMWIEFEADDGQLAFAKLAWVSPLRGTYLFTNRQGQKALSMTAEDLADRFRADRARLVEAEPLIDRAFTSMITQIEQKFPETANIH